MLVIMNPVREQKYADEPRYWSLRDDDYKRVRIDKTHRINPQGKVVPV